MDMSRHGHIAATITRQIRRPSRLIDPIKKKPFILSPVDQNIASPMCLFDEQSTQSLTVRSSDSEQASSDNESSSTSAGSNVSDSEPSTTLDGTWTTPNVSRISRRARDLGLITSSRAQISQCNTNYAPNGLPMSTDPSEIDKCTELEAMRQGLARIQAGHARPSDFLPERQGGSIDPYVRRTLDEIRQSINQISNDAALQNEVQELRQSVKALNQFQAAPGRLTNGSESQLAGLLQDIRQSLRPVPPSEATLDNAGNPMDSVMMRTLEEIRESVHALQAAVEGEELEPECEAQQSTEESNNQMMEVIDEIRQSLRALEEGTTGTDQDNTNENENTAILEALNDIRQSVNALVNNTDPTPESDKGEQQEAILGALTDIKKSVKLLADQGDSRAAEDDFMKGQCEGEVAKATCDMARSMEDLQKTVEMITDKMLNKCTVVCKPEKSKDKCKKSHKRKKSKCKKPKPPPESELSEDELSECIKECCKDSCKIGSTCEKLIKFLISQNASAPKNGAPAVHYLVPPAAQAPRFIAPYPRPPRALPHPPALPQAQVGLPSQPSMNYSQGQGAPPNLQMPPPRVGPPCPPPPQPSMSVYSAPPQPMPCYPQPSVTVPPASQHLPSMASFVHLPQPSTVSYGSQPQQQPPTQFAPPAFNQTSVYSQQPSYHQTSINVPEPRISANEPKSLRPSQTTSVLSKPVGGQEQPVVFSGSVNDQPMAFTLAFDGDPASGSGRGSSLANRRFICTQVEE